MDNPLISIVIPIYNVEAYLKECLDSIANQTATNFTALLINDGSKDNSVKIAESYVAKHPSIFQLYHKKNGGLSDARNFGINKATTDYVMFVDSDDIIALDAIEVVTSALKNSFADVLCFGMTEITECGAHVRNIPATTGSLLESSLASNPDLLTKALPNACNKAVKLTLLKDNAIVFPKGLWYEDLATTPKLLHLAKSISFISDYLYHYRTREGSITQTINPKILDMLEVLASLDSYFNNSSSPEFKDALLTLKTNMLMKTLVRLSAYSDKVQQQTMLKSVQAYIRDNMPSTTKLLSINTKFIYRFTVLLASLRMDTLLLIFLATCLKKGLVRA